MSAETTRWKPGGGRVRPLSTTAAAADERRWRENGKALRKALRSHIDATGADYEELAREIGIDYVRLVAILANGVPGAGEAERIAAFLDGGEAAG
jgi:hypothetical protein